MADSSSLRPILKNVNKTLAKLREDVQTLTGEVKKIPEILTEGFKDVRDAIHESIRAQAEMKLIEHMSDAHTIRPQIEAEQEQIEVEKEDLEERLNSISERFEEKHNELDDTAEERIRDLGEHIFHIDEVEYEQGIEQPLEEKVTSTWAELQRHNTDIHETRSERLVGQLEETEEEVDAFISQREQMLKDIEQHKTSVAKGLSQPASLEIPFWAVNVEKDGVVEQIIIGPSKLEHNEDDVSDVQPAIELAVFDGANESIKDVATNADVEADQIPDEPDRIAEEITQFTDDKLFGYLSYAEEMEKSLKDGSNVEVDADV